MDATYFELARFWVSAERGRSLCMVSFPDRWTPELLGSLLVESVHIAAEAYAAQTGMPETEARQKIWLGFDKERASLEQSDTEK